MARDLATSIRLYLLFFRLRMQAYMQYRADAMMMAASALLTDGTGLILLWVIFQQVPAVAGWTAPEVALIYGIMIVAEGVTQTFFDGLWTIGSGVYEGRFDIFLSRPMPALLAVLTFWMSPEGLSHVLLGVVLCSFAIIHLHLSWHPLSLVIWAALVGCGLAVRINLTLIINCVGFWLKGPLASGVGDISEPIYGLGTYPLAVYSRPVKAVLTAVIPVAFVAALPAAYLVKAPSRYGWIEVAEPSVALALGAVGIWLFRAGVRGYSSAGN